MVDAARRGFLRGRPRPRTELRPPWALAENDFIDRCTRCNDCLKACPQDILVSGDGGYPSIDFTRGECTFCADCLSACQPQALLRRDGEPPWPYKAAAGEACLARQQVECRSCGDFCPEGALRFPARAGGPALPVLLEDRCTGCGACLAPCPTAAISIGRPD